MSNRAPDGLGVDVRGPVVVEPQPGCLDPVDELVLPEAVMALEGGVVRVVEATVRLQVGDDEPAAGPQQVRDVVQEARDVRNWCSAMTL